MSVNLQSVKKLLEITDQINSIQPLKPDQQGEIEKIADSILVERKVDEDEIGLIAKKIKVHPNIDETHQLTLLCLRNLSRDDLMSALDLNNWETTGSKKEACEIIIKCLVNQYIDLNLSGQNLSSLPNCIFSKIFSFNKLICRNNRLKIVPHSIGQVSKLIYLDISNNDIRSLPESIGQLKQLEKLICCANKLETLPESIAQLKQLTHLNCSHNELKALPESIGQLKQLTHLNCNFNQIESIPNSIKKCSELINLSLEYNLYLTSLPIEILNLAATCRVYMMETGLSQSILDHLHESTLAAGYDGPRFFYSMRVSPQT